MTKVQAATITVKAVCLYKFIVPPFHVSMTHVDEMYFHRVFFIVQVHITPATRYPKAVIPAKAGIQEDTGCRIKSGMTKLGYLFAGLIIFSRSEKMKYFLAGNRCSCK
jgi:hypothetical protein